MTGDSHTLAPNLAMIGAYRVVQQIGQGGMGTVYLAEHSLLGRKAAIKVLHPTFSVREDIVKRFFNEARATTSIADPGIVQIFDFGFQDGIAYIVMEYLVGDTLLARLRGHRRFPEVEVLRLTRQIALSLHAAHNVGVVHRDLKPDNVFIVADSEAVGGERTKVLDFGIAKLIDDPDRHRTQTGLVLGTPTYMSPEQCRGAGEVDHRADIYSLGCMMFRCLTGRLPFEAQGSGELIAMHLREPAPAPSQFVPVRPEIDAIVLRCMAKNPDDRFRSMHALATEVDNLLRTITAPPGLNLAGLTPMPPAPNNAPPSIEISQPPTTLSSVASEVSKTAPKPRWPMIASVALVGVICGIFAIVAITSRDHGTPATTTVVAPATAPISAPTPAPAPPPVAVTAPVVVTPPTVPVPTTGSAGSAAPTAKTVPTKGHKTKSSTESDLYNDR